MPRPFVLLCHAALLSCLPTTASLASAVFMSGAVPDLADPASFGYGDDSIFGFPSPPADARYYLLDVEQGALAAPVTVASIEFYGYTLLSEDQFLIDLFGEPDPDHGFEIGLGAPINVLNVVRTDVGPAFPAPLGFTSTPVQRIQIDFDPITFDDDSTVVLRGDTGAAEDFYLAWADPAIAETALSAYLDSDLLVVDSVTTGAAFQFTLFDEFQTFVPGDTDGDGDVDLIDLDTLGSNFGVSGASGGASIGDFDGDGDVDLIDLDTLGANFGLGTSAAVPEPGAFGMVLLAGGLLIGLRGRG